MFFVSHNFAMNIGKFATNVLNDLIVVLPRMPILDISTKVPNAGIVDGRDCGGALMHS
jgi:hypothetical protein